MVTADAVSPEVSGLKIHVFSAVGRVGEPPLFCFIELCQGAFVFTNHIQTADGQGIQVAVYHEGAGIGLLPFVLINISGEFLIVVVPVERHQFGVVLQAVFSGN